MVLGKQLLYEIFIDVLLQEKKSVQKFETILRITFLPIKKETPDSMIFGQSII